MYANAALIRPNYEPGQYNSGGPLPHSMDVWRAGAPSLDFLSPDIYFNEFVHWAGEYTQRDNPLFIPEAQGGATGATNVLYAVGPEKAIGFSAFGVDDQGNSPLDLVGITNPAEHVDGGALGSMYLTLSRLESLLLKGQQTGGLSAALIEGDAQRAARTSIGAYTANVARLRWALQLQGRVLERCSSRQAQTSFWWWAREMGWSPSPRTHRGHLSLELKASMRSSSRTAPGRRAGDLTETRTLRDRR